MPVETLHTPAPTETATHTASPVPTGEHASPVETHATTEHAGPHILTVRGEPIAPGSWVTTTILSTWIFMAILFIAVGFLYTAIKTNLFPRVRTFGLDIVRRLDSFLSDTLGNTKVARIFLPLVGGFFIFIFLGNIWGLIIDWIGMWLPSVHQYLRPINSDMGTTVVLALVTIIVAQLTGIIKKGFIPHFKHYVFNTSGHNIIEKIINVPVGWIHIFSELSRILSLSVRLFANIFAGAALLAVMAYLGTLLHAGFVGGILVLPFWFFELLVAFLQAFIFMMLTSMYLKESITIEHH